METFTCTEVPAAKPEWYRLSDAIRVSGIGRSSLYELIREGRVKSVCLRKRNNTRGIRLINADSLTAFLNSFVNETRRHDEGAA
jgi:hypothetical protein